MKTDHIGYLVASLADSRRSFAALGFTVAGDPVDDPVQRARIQFLSGPGGERVELVEPHPDNRSLLRMLDKRGPGVYHVCYGAEDLDAMRTLLLESGWTPLSRPVPAPALGGRRICYFWKEEVGFLEFVEDHI